jgi:hypothetical protein
LYGVGVTRRAQRSAADAAKMFFVFTSSPRSPRSIAPAALPYAIQLFWHNYFLLKENDFMQIRNWFAAAALSLLFACNNPGEKISDSGTATDTIPGASSTSAGIDTTLAGCYSSIINKDTSAMQIETKGAVVSGPLSYNIFEKDRNDGNFQGEVRGNILTGWYLFKSEGMMSVRQVAWKINGRSLWPGYGEVTQKGDTMLFKNIDQLRFDSTRPFTKVPCTL